MTGAFLGALFAIGVLLIASHVIATRPARLAVRIAPYIPARQVAGRVGPLSTLVAVFEPSMRSVFNSLASSASLSERLLRAGRVPSTTRYRLTQMVWIGSGLLMASSVIIVTSNTTLIGLLLIGLGGIAGALACDAELKSAMKRRKRRILVQLPMVADLFAFAVAAGESSVSAIERISSTMSGDLPREFATCVGDVHNGLPFGVALRAAAARCDVPQFNRFVEGVVLALERGTPIAEVVRAQAMDVRAQEQRRLMELAGRKDVIMLIPIVFMILPTVVLIAVYPGLYSLDLVVA